ncbi:MAG: Bax inhibitor-1/YccA family protein [Deltaproteobacteria bacterium]|nr:Bax inhibitor-1/YccA family protein [Deltaproteobacteria bacterium]
MQYSSTLETSIRSRDEIDIRAGKYVSGVYARMMMGVLLTAVVAYGLVVSGMMDQILLAGGSVFALGIFVLQFATVMMFRPMMQSASAGKVKALYYFYAAVTGVTVGFVGMVYTAASILNVFAAAAFAFGGLAAYGHTTRRNLGVVGTFCVQALWMTVGLSLIYLLSSFVPFLRPFAQTLNITTGILGVLVFSGLTAYESQQLSQNAYTLARSPASEATISMYTTSGALTMYLNFINLFFSLLRLFGDRRR